MSDYIKPVLQKKPDNIVLHVGTNNTTNKKAAEIMTISTNYVKKSKKLHHYAEMIISELINREDNRNAKQTVNEINKLLHFCLMYF